MSRFGTVPKPSILRHAARSRARLDDTERTSQMVRNIVGKRLTYQTTRRRIGDTRLRVTNQLLAGRVLKIREHTMLSQCSELTLILNSGVNCDFATMPRLAATKVQ